MNCERTENVCIETETLTVDEQFTVWWRNDFTANNNGSIKVNCKLKQGMPSLEDPCDFGNSNPMIQSWELDGSPITHNSSILSSQLKISDSDKLHRATDTENNFYFQMDRDGQCVSGPIYQSEVPFYKMPQFKILAVVAGVLLLCQLAILIYYFIFRRRILRQPENADFEFEVRKSKYEEETNTSNDGSIHS
jgi:hypothetical protein